MRLPGERGASFERAQVCLLDPQVGKALGIERMQLGRRREDPPGALRIAQLVEHVEEAEQGPGLDARVPLRRLGCRLVRSRQGRAIVTAGVTECGQLQGGTGGTEGISVAPALLARPLEGPSRSLDLARAPVDGRAREQEQAGADAVALGQRPRVGRTAPAELAPGQLAGDVDAIRARQAAPAGIDRGGIGSALICAGALVERGRSAGRDGERESRGQGPARRRQKH